MRKTDTVLVLFTNSAINAFTNGGKQLKLGAEMGMAWGPLGRDLTADVGAGRGGFTSSFAYSHSQGYYGGYAISGEIVRHRNHDNEAYYKQIDVSVKEVQPGGMLQYCDGCIASNTTARDFL